MSCVAGERAPAIGQGREVKGAWNRAGREGERGREREERHTVF